MCKETCVLSYANSSPILRQMPRYTMTKNKHLPSPKVIGSGSLVHVQGKTNRETTGHAFSATLTFQKPLKYVDVVLI